MPLIATVGDDKRKKYHHPQYDDNEIEKLATYFRMDGYPNFMVFLKKLGAD